jgi:dipeptide transport system permease protein
MAIQLDSTRPEAVAPPGPLAEFWHYFSENKGAVAGLVVIVIVVLAALFADVVAPHPAAEQYRDHFLAPPFWQDGGSIRFVLGTDAVGRDMLSRIIYGSRFSLMIGLIVVTLSLSVGVMLGLIAGFARGWLESLIMRMMDIVLALPSLLLAIVIVAILGPGLVNAMIAVAIVYIPHYTRLTRASVITETTKDYVTASRVTGRACCA